MKKARKFCTIFGGMAGFISIATVLAAFAHGEKAPDKGAVSQSSSISQDAVREIGDSYLRSIKPIFERKCFDCHSAFTKFPWYYKVPGVKQLIDRDIQNARRHIDFSSDFPFLSHGTPIGDLRDIAEEVKENEMPPWNYKLIHWGSALTAEEKSAVLEWVQKSIAALTNSTL